MSFDQGVLVSDSERSSVVGVGVSWGAGSAHSSWDVVRLVEVVGVLGCWEAIDSGFRGVVSLSLTWENLDGGAEGDCVVKVVGVIALVAGVGIGVVGAAR